MKKIKIMSRKFLTTLLMFGILFQTFAPALVLADPVCEDANQIVIGGSSSRNDNTFSYDHGSATVTVNGAPVNSATFNVVPDDVVRIVLTPDATYSAKLHNEGQDYDVTLVNNEYEFTIHNIEPAATLALTPSFYIDNGEDSPIENLKFDFTINGESFTDVSVGDEVLVSENFNMDTLEELYITKIVDGDKRTYTYEDGEYSFDLLNSEGKHILETFFAKKSNSYVQLRVMSHVDAILAEDLDRYNKTIDDYFALYITGLKLVKSGFRGVEIKTDNMPDNYDFTAWNGVDLGATTLNNPGVVTAYYGEDTISLDPGELSSPIETIELVENNGVPSSAVEINNENGTIRVLSNYYNQLLVKVELEDGTIGYVMINRIGIFIGDLNQGQDTFYHGAANGDVNGNLDVETDKQRLVAVFYHEDTTTFEDYDLIVNIVYKDGTTETKIATGVGDVANMKGNIVGSDYILWSGESLYDSLAKVSVTAVRKDAVTNETTFGGATFGSGSGVVWENE